MEYEVRAARPEDLAGLPPIESSGDAMFAEIGIVFPPGPTVVEQMIEKGAEILVAGPPPNGAPPAGASPGGDLPGGALPDGALPGGASPVGFAALEEVDGAVHLEQISVRGDLVGRGIGARLLDAVMARAAAEGAPGVSLLTFRDVPWNEPWYARHGFAELPEERWGPEIRSYWDAEIKAGLHELGPRLVMWAAAARRPS
ncbi:GNAT family N-acetyltransferase [Actinomadura sp. 9N215]|uniref:GNAT family N-acetyltransferase n=1 Tax=Actinomadura sp. 9N215 TaxID=3375150 RepID=UPI0037A5C7A1